jgi:hypothetical protein
MQRKFDERDYADLRRKCKIRVEPTTKARIDEAKQALFFIYHLTFISQRLTIFIFK